VGDRSDIKELIQEASQRLRAEESAVLQAEQSRARVERELALLVELAELWGWAREDLARISTVSLEPTSDRRAEVPVATHRKTPAKEALLKAVVEILGERKKPMQIGELMAAVQARGVSIPGAGRQANLIGIITKDRRIRRARRGFYTLSRQSAGSSTAS
jgi:hypothetical protein